MTPVHGRKKWIWLGVATLLIFGLLAGGTYEAYDYWSSPDFCHSCHIMDPYYQSWAASSHKDVACVACHFEPGIENELRGKWVAVKQLASAVTGAYSSMPYAEVSDASCMRSGCHTVEELDEPLRFSDHDVQFDHAQHLGEMRRGIKLACTSCHSQRLLTTHMELDQATCFLCHFKEAEAGGRNIGQCGSCHGPPGGTREVAGFTVDHADYQRRGMACVQCHVEMVSGTGAVGRERCFSCHNRPEQIEKFDDPGLLHVEHVTRRKLHCYQCHGMIDHRLETGVRAPGEAGECADCHQSTHGAQAKVYAGQGATGVPAIADGMHALGLDCVGCHRAAPVPGGGNGPHAGVFGSGAASCAGCHGERYEEFVAEGVGNLNAMLEHLDRRLGAVRAKVDELRAGGGFLERATYRAYAHVSQNVELLKTGRPAHNPLYAVAVLRAGLESVEELEEALAVEFDDDAPFGFMVEDCGVCHDSLPMPGELTVGEGYRYPHPKHVEETGLGCADCHAGETHPPAAPTTETSCKACHKDGLEKLRR